MVSIANAFLIGSNLVCGVVVSLAILYILFLAIASMVGILAIVAGAGDRALGGLAK